jgi:cyclase
VRIFNQKYVDEILLLDIDRSRNNLGPDFNLVKRVNAECFMPLSYGGGIRNLADAKELFALGVEKIVLQTAAINNLVLISQVAKLIGSQGIAISVDVKQNRSGSYVVYHSASKQVMGIPLLDYIKRIQDAGAGELILTSIAHEGRMQGYNLDLIKLVRDTVTIPIVAHGGAGSIQHFADAIASGADAVAAGSFFVFYGPRKGVLITYPSYDALETVMGESRGE